MLSLFTLSLFASWFWENHRDFSRFKFYIRCSKVISIVLVYSEASWLLKKQPQLFQNKQQLFQKKNQNYSRLPDDDDEASEGTEKKGMFKKNRKGQVDVFKSQLHSDFM